MKVKLISLVAVVAIGVGFVGCNSSTCDSISGVLDTNFNDNGVVLYDSGVLGKDYYLKDTGTEQKGNAIAIAKNGDVYVAGFAIIADEETLRTTYPEMMIRSYKSDGSLNTAFNANGTPGMVTYSNGVVGRGDKANAIAIDNSGNIYVAGYTHASYDGGNTYYSDIMIRSYKPDGSLNTAFNPNGTPGMVTYDVQNYGDKANAIVFDGNNTLYVAGVYENGDGENPDIIVLSYNLDGSLNEDFNKNGTISGIVTYDGGISEGDKATAITLGDNGNIYVVGDSSDGTSKNIIVLSYKPDGSLNEDFNPDGTTPGVVIYDSVREYTSTTGDEADAIAFDGNETLYVAGKVPNESDDNADLIVLSYNINGSLNTDFNETGLTLYDSDLTDNDRERASAINIDCQGNIYVAGGYRDNSPDHKYPLVISYKADGSLNTEFNETGIMTFDSTPYSKNDLPWSSVNAMALTNGSLYLTGCMFNGVQGDDDVDPESESDMMLLKFK